MVTESRRRANNRWDRENMTVVGCKITKEKAARFKAACEAAGTNVNAVFLKVVNEWLKEDK